MSLDLIQTGGGGVAFVDSPSGGVGSALLGLTWNVARGATNTVQVGILPANARIAAIFVQVPIVSNAATTATVSVGLVGGSATFFSAAQDVKGAVGNFSQAATANWAVSGLSQKVSCTYTETGAASNAGTFTVVVMYTLL
jgi:hypothetical protein